MHGQGGTSVAGEVATTADGAHPIGIHSCFLLQSLELTKLLKYRDQHICKSLPTKQKFLLTATEPRDRHTLQLEVKVNMVPDDESDAREPYPVVLKPQLVAELGERQNGN